MQGFVIAGSSVGAATSPSHLCLAYGSPGLARLLCGGGDLHGSADRLFGICERRIIHPRLPYIRDKEATRASAKRWGELFAIGNCNCSRLLMAVSDISNTSSSIGSTITSARFAICDADESAGYTTILFVTEGVMMPLGGFVSDRMTRSTRSAFRSARCGDGGPHA